MSNANLIGYTFFSTVMTILNNHHPKFIQACAVTSTNVSFILLYLYGINVTISNFRVPECVFLEILAYGVLNPPARQLRRFCLCWLNWPGSLAGRFYAPVAMISKNMHSGTPNNAVLSCEGSTSTLTFY